MEYTIEELLNYFNNGLLDPNMLEVVIDNDCTNFYIANEPIKIKGLGDGYNDIETLYKYIFSKSRVNWC